MDIGNTNIARFAKQSNIQYNISSGRYCTHVVAFVYLVTTWSKNNLRDIYVTKKVFILSNKMVMLIEYITFAKQTSVVHCIMNNSLPNSMSSQTLLNH